jgi:hypothetical protein
VLADQRGAYDRMRAACPVAESPRGITLFRHADVVAAATDPATFSSAVSAHRMVPNSLDRPDHSAFRAVIDPFFSLERIRALRHGSGGSLMRSSASCRVALLSMRSLRSGTRSPCEHRPTGWGDKASRATF